MSDFEREERYIVIKRKHLTGPLERELRERLYHWGVPTVECVVVEPDWPNFDATWRAIQQIEEGTYDPDEITRLQSEVERLRGRLAEFGDRITYGVLAQGEFVGYEDGYDDALELAEECGGTVFGIYAQRLRQQAAESE